GSCVHLNSPPHCGHLAGSSAGAPAAPRASWSAAGRGWYVRCGKGRPGVGHHTPPASWHAGRCPPPRTLRNACERCAVTWAYGLGNTTMSTPSAGERRGHVTRAQHTCPCMDGLAERQGFRHGAGYSCTCPCAPRTVCVGCLSHNVACGLGGDVHAAEGCLTRLRVPSPQPFQTALPEAVPPGSP